MKWHLRDPITLRLKLERWLDGMMDWIDKWLPRIAWTAIILTIISLWEASSGR